MVIISARIDIVKCWYPIRPGLDRAAKQKPRSRTEAGPFEPEAGGALFKRAAEVVHRLYKALVKLHLGGPDQFLFGQADIGLALARVVLRQRLIYKLALAFRDKHQNLLGQFLYSELVRVAYIHRALKIADRHMHRTAIFPDGERAPGLFMFRHHFFNGNFHRQFGLILHCQPFFHILYLP